jgi:hypothetical protein
MKIFARACASLLFTPLLVHAQQPASATFRPTLLESFDAEYSYSAPADLKRGPALGEVAVHHTQVSFSGRLPTKAAMVIYGAAASVNTLEADAGLALPDRLGELTLNLGVSKRFSPQWSAAFFLRPGVYGDLEDFSSDTFNAPALLLVNYATSEALRWTLGVRADFFSDRAVLPVAGVSWAFQPGWKFELGFPRAGVSWEKNEGFTLRAGLSVQGGSYRLTQDLGSPAPGVARLRDTYVEYRELRLGAGAEWKVAEKMSILAEAGVMTDRRFEYYDRNYTLNGDAAPYVTLGVKGRF